MFKAKRTVIAALAFVPALTSCAQTSGVDAPTNQPAVGESVVVAVSEPPAPRPKDFDIARREAELIELPGDGADVGRRGDRLVLTLPNSGIIPFDDFTASAVSEPPAPKSKRLDIEKREAELIELPGDGADIDRRGDRLAVTLPNGVVIPFDDFTVSAVSEPPAPKPKGLDIERQEAELIELLGDGADVDRRGDRLVVTLPNSVIFPFGDFTVSEEAKAKYLHVLADSLRDHPDSRVEIIGRAGGLGGKDGNLHISERRANGVRDALSRRGVRKHRMAVGADRAPRTRWAPPKNRRGGRVEIFIIPAT